MDFLDMTPKAQATKVKIAKLNYITIKNFHVKDTTNRVKRQPVEWEKNICNHMYHGGLITQIQRELLKLNNKKQPNQKMGGRSKK